MTTAIATESELTTELAYCISLYQVTQYQECLVRIEALKLAFPDNIDIKYINALCYLAFDRLDESEYLFNECLKSVQNSDILFVNIAALYAKKSDTEKVIQAYNQALAINPNNIAAINNLGTVYHATGQHYPALECFNKLVSLGHDSYYVYNNIALVYKDLNLLEEARDAINKSLSSNPPSYEPYHNAALISTYMHNKQDAFKCYEIASQLAPNNIEIISGYRDLCVNVCDWEKYDELQSRIIALTNTDSEPLAVWPMGDISRYIDIKHNLECAIAFTKKTTADILKNHTPFSHKGRKANNGRLRIGYVSSDIKDHPVAHLTRGIFRNHDKDKFEIFLYSSSYEDKSECQNAIRSYCDHFIDVRNLSDFDIAKKIYEDQIDVIVDLNGHTEGQKLRSLALKPAPVQISYIGFIGSMGADFIDYIITDKIVTPPEHQKYYTEKFLYMPHCYQANDNEFKISQDKITRSDVGLPEKAFVFCSFNQTYKIERALFERWMNILKRVPGSVLWLYKGSNYTHDNLAKENLIKHAIKAGIDPARLIFAEGVDIAKHIKRTSLADLALDTKVYNGGTVTSQTLWAGVPVITLEGGHFASRMASSIVSAVGLSELVTKNPEEYEELAVKIATTKGAATRLKKKLQKNKINQPLFNTIQFTRDIENLYQEAFANFLKSQ